VRSQHSDAGHAQALRDALARYVAAARRAGGGPSGRLGRAQGAGAG